MSETLVTQFRDKATADNRILSTNSSRMKTNVNSEHENNGNTTNDRFKTNLLVAEATLKKIYARMNFSSETY